MTRINFTYTDEARVVREDFRNASIAYDSAIEHGLALTHLTNPDGSPVGFPTALIASIEGSV